MRNTERDVEIIRRSENSRSNEMKMGEVQSSRVSRGSRGEMIFNYCRLGETRERLKSADPQLLELWDEREEKRRREEVNVIRI